MHPAELLRNALRTVPDQPALHVGDQSWTYRQLDDLSSRLAAALLAEGIRPGDRLAFFLPNCAEIVLSYLACFKAGIVAVPLNYRYLAPQIDYALENSRSAALVLHAERLDELRRSERAGQLKHIYAAGGTSAEFQSFDRLLEHPEPRTLPLPQPTDLAFIMYTSGTTAYPKGVMHTHAGVGHMVVNRLATVPLLPSEVSLVSLSIAHIAGLTGQVLTTLNVGGKVVLLKQFEPAAFYAELRRHPDTTFLEQLPAALSAMVHFPGAKRADYSALRLCISGGDKVPLPLHKAFRELTGVEVTEVCGMTEAMDYTINPPFGPKKLGSVGQPLHATRIRVVDDLGHDVPTGETGEMVVQSKAVMAGYWNNPEETQRALRDGWLHTGDLGRYDADGYLWFMGRKKDIIIHGGSNVSPQEVEDIFYHHPAVQAVGVIGVPDPVYGQNILAFVVLRELTPRPTEAELLAFARQHISLYMTPEHIVFLDKMPMNATGKVDRATLRQRARVSSP